MVAMRAGQVVMMGNVIGSPSAALATNQAACAIPQGGPAQQSWQEGRSLRHPWLVSLANSIDDKYGRGHEPNAHKIGKDVIET